MTFAAGIMHGACRGVDDDIPTELPKPCAQVYVLIVEEVCLVESSYRGESLPPEYDKHAGNPVRRKDTLCSIVVRHSSWRNKLAQKGQGCGESAGVVLNSSFRAYNQRRDSTHFRPLEIAQELREGVAGKADVGIENAEVLPLGVRKGRVMVGAESLPLRVGQHLEGKWVLLMGDCPRLRYVDGKDDFEWYFRAASQVLQQTRNQGALTMTDYGNRQDIAR